MDINIKMVIAYCLKPHGNQQKILWRVINVKLPLLWNDGVNVEGLIRWGRKLVETSLPFFYQWEQIKPVMLLASRLTMTAGERPYIHYHLFIGWTTLKMHIKVIERTLTEPYSATYVNRDEATLMTEETGRLELSPNVCHWLNPCLNYSPIP